VSCTGDCYNDPKNCGCSIAELRKSLCDSLETLEMAIDLDADSYHLGNEMVRVVRSITRYADAKGIDLVAAGDFVTMVDRSEGAVEREQ